MTIPTVPAVESHAGIAADPFFEFATASTIGQVIQCRARSIKRFISINFTLHLLLHVENWAARHFGFISGPATARVLS